MGGKGYEIREIGQVDGDLEVRREVEQSNQKQENRKVSTRNKIGSLEVEDGEIVLMNGGKCTSEQDTTMGSGAKRQRTDGW